mmetsp:Transcript_10514/g.30024  ORF Transcript_10514/g.30024 Transcript_10514/m.30024 type:complete len:261 (-) Transcript_10514:1304-2086(-)
MESWNLSWNSKTPNCTHTSNGPELCSNIRLTHRIFASCEVPVPSDGIFARYPAGSSMNVFTSRGLSTKSCSNKSRDHSIVCSMACGKCFSVHKGMDSSGGSWESPYDCVLCGSTTCTLAFVPSVPDSNNGFANQTHRESTYKRAWTLSKALITQSKPAQKGSSKVSSVSAPTRPSIAWTFRSPFMACAAAAEVKDFGLPTSFCRNRNCRFKFEISILSMSVTVTLPSGPQQAPSIARVFKYSQPKAPAPTMNNFKLATRS